MTLGTHCLIKYPQLCAPENYDVITSLIVSTLNEDVSYSTQPIELRSQRVYAIKVTKTDDGTSHAIADIARLV